MKWTKQYLEHSTEYRGYKISRTGMKGQVKLYYAHAVKNPHYAAPNYHMSDKLYSLQATKKLIDKWISEGIYFNYYEVKKIKTG